MLMRLAGQYPDLFQAAAMRNPVTHIPSMVGITDIPDWCFVETGALCVPCFCHGGTFLNDRRHYSHEGHDYDFDKAFRHVTETELKVRREKFCHLLSCVESLASLLD